jgi:O-antigen biosynthesis protein
MKNEAVEKTYYSAKTLPKYSSLATILGFLNGKERKILDVGCASGYLGKLIKERNPKCDIWGIDGNKEAVKEAERDYKQVWLLNLNEPIPGNLTNEKFDVIIFADVLEHLLFAEEVLKYFRSRLKPGGRILVSLPNVGNWRVRFGLLLGSFNYQDYGVLDRTHVQLYTFATAKRLLEKAGFQVMRARPTANLSIQGALAQIPFLRGLLGIQVVQEGVPR